MRCLIWTLVYSSPLCFSFILCVHFLFFFCVPSKTILHLPFRAAGRLVCFLFFSKYSNAHCSFREMLKWYCDDCFSCPPVLHIGFAHKTDICISFACCQCSCLASRNPGKRVLNGTNGSFPNDVHEEYVLDSNWH